MTTTRPTTTSQINDLIGWMRKNIRAARAARPLVQFFDLVCQISNGNRTQWSPIRSVIRRVITKSDDRAAGVRFVYHEYDNRLNWTTRSPIYCQLIIKITISEKRKVAKLCDKGKFYIKNWQRMHKFRSLYTVSIVIETKVVIGWFKLQL